MAVHGSTRATRDCDYAMEKTETAIRRSVLAMLDEGFEAIFEWDYELDEPRRVDSRPDIVAAWAVVDQPESIWFWNPKPGTRIDLVFDLPMPFEDLRTRAARPVINGVRVLVASPTDLLLMKQASVKSRTDAMKRISDEQDIILLRALIEAKS
jgi:hypothetical protein